MKKKIILFFLLALVLVGSTISGISMVYSTKEDYILLYYPTGVAIDSSGNVYVIDSWNDLILKLTGDGKFITKWGSHGSDDGQFLFPTGVAIDSSGNVYISDVATNRIQKFTGDGKFITKWGSHGSDDGQFINPKGVAVDSLSNVYVVDQNNNRIQKFTGDGKFITKWGSKCISPPLYPTFYGVCPSPGDREFWYPDGGIAVDSLSNVYVVDQNNNRIQKFTGDGKFITKWGLKGFDDKLTWPRAPSEGPSGIAVNLKAGKLYATIGNDQIQTILL